jgi:hypothetical protein
VSQPPHQASGGAVQCIIHCRLGVGVAGALMVGLAADVHTECVRSNRTVRADCKHCSCAGQLFQALQERGSVTCCCSPALVDAASSKCIHSSSLLIRHMLPT